MDLKFGAGDIVYTKIFQKSLAPKSPPANFQGMAAMMLLGHVPVHGKDLTSEQVILILGQMGLIMLDDVAEFLSKEQAEECVVKFDAKYFPKKEKPEEEKSEEPAAPTGGKLIHLVDKYGNNKKQNDKQ